MQINYSSISERAASINEVLFSVSKFAPNTKYQFNESLGVFEASGSWWMSSSVTRWVSSENYATFCGKLEELNNRISKLADEILSSLKVDASEDWRRRVGNLVADLEDRLSGTEPGFKNLLHTYEPTPFRYNCVNRSVGVFKRCTSEKIKSLKKEIS